MKRQIEPNQWCKCQKLTCWIMIASSSNPPRLLKRRRKKNIKFNYFSFVTDLAAIRKILENETGGTTCPSCKMPFDKGKKRKLIDTCGHDRCYSCMFKNESCTICANTQRHQRQEAQRETSTGKSRRTKCSIARKICLKSLQFLSLAKGSRTSITLFLNQALCTLWWTYIINDYLCYHKLQTTKMTDNFGCI